VRALGLVVVAACAAHGFTDDDRAAIERVLARQVEAWNRGDLDGFMAGYERSDRLLFTSGSKVRRGWDETLTKYRARYGEDPSTMGRLALSVLDLRPVGDGAAVVLGHWKLDNTPEAGGGIFSLVLERSAGGWRIVHDHTSSE
jgi:uncharacterized protein (TIGR02246 family)